MVIQKPLNYDGEILITVEDNKIWVDLCPRVSTGYTATLRNSVWCRGNGYEFDQNQPSFEIK